MMYLTILFVSPVYFLIRKKWAGFILNSFLYLMFLCTILLFGLGLFFWALAVGHAAWHIRKEEMVEQAELIALKMSQQNTIAESN